MSELCLKPMKRGMLCGRKLGHSWHCKSRQAVGHDKFRHHNNLVEHRQSVPPALLPQAKQDALARYRASGLVMPGDTLYQKLVTS